MKTMKDTLAAQLAPHRNKFATADADAFTPPTFGKEPEYSNFDLGALGSALSSTTGALLGGTSGVATADCGAMPTKGIFDLSGNYQKQYDAWKSCTDTAQKIKLQQANTDALLAQAAAKGTTDTGMSTGVKIAIGVGAALAVTTIIIIIVKARK